MIAKELKEKIKDVPDDAVVVLGDRWGESLDADSAEFIQLDPGGPKVLFIS